MKQIDLCQLYDKTPDQIISEATETVKQIISASERGELALLPFYKKILCDARAFIRAYHKEVNSLIDDFWPVELAKKKLTIVLWWKKVVLRPDRDLHFIRAIYEGCSDEPRVLAGLLGIPLDKIHNPQIKSTGEPCPICAARDYRPEDGACMNCGDMTNAKKYKTTVDAYGDVLTIHGEVCSKCGGTERYVKNNNCYHCTKERLRIMREKKEAARKDKEEKYLKQLDEKHGFKSVEEREKFFSADERIARGLVHFVGTGEAQKRDDKVCPVCSHSVYFLRTGKCVVCKLSLKYAPETHRKKIEVFSTEPLYKGQKTKVVKTRKPKKEKLPKTPNPPRIKREKKERAPTPMREYKPCKVCGCTLRYINCKKCVDCHKRKQKERAKAKKLEACK